MSLPSFKMPGLSILELSLMTSPTGYYWEYIDSYWACVRSRNWCL